MACTLSVLCFFLQSTCRFRASNGTCDNATLVRRNSSDIESATEVNLQRPEMLQSLYHMWRTTRDEKYRGYAWDALMAMIKFQKVDTGGFAESVHIMQSIPGQNDRQHSHLLSETLKYALLLFGQDDLLGAGQVMSGGHPFG